MQIARPHVNRKESIKHQDENPRNSCHTYEQFSVPVPTSLSKCLKKIYSFEKTFFLLSLRHFTNFPSFAHACTVLYML